MIANAPGPRILDVSKFTRTTGNGGERIVVNTYEYLPATPANLALLK
jgi:hypothetical protein